MTGTERIKEKILSEAAENAETIQKTAIAEAEAILSEAQQVRTEAEARTERQIDTKKEALLGRNEATLQLEKRKQVLAARQEVMQIAFRKATLAMLDLPLPEYRELLLSMVNSLEWQGDAEIVVSEKDSKRLNSDFIEAIDVYRHKKNRTGKTVFAPDTLQNGGGFIVRTGEIELNGTFDVVIDSIRPKLENSVADILFQ